MLPWSASLSRPTSGETRNCASWPKFGDELQKRSFGLLGLSLLPGEVVGNGPVMVPPGVVGVVDGLMDGEPGPVVGLGVPGGGVVGVTVTVWVPLGVGITGPGSTWGWLRNSSHAIRIATSISSTIVSNDSISATLEAGRSTEG